MISGSLIRYDATGGYVPEFCRSWYAAHDGEDVQLLLKPAWRVIPWDELRASRHVLEAAEGER